MFMKIRKILIEDKIKEKIFYRHHVTSLEIKDILFNNPFVLKVSDGRYMAIGHYQRFITIIFGVQKDMAFIVTAYPSSEAQRKLYKLRKK